ncbi:MAG TPA: DUF6348 family protein [Kofleriaceae bacterium]|nr:DUF6348 family protein [Kofleriaceae bacterium]
MFGPQVGGPLETLLELFRNHGVLGRIDDGWLLLPRGCRARATLHDSDEDHALQLDVEIYLWLGSTVHESVRGVGATRPERERDAWAAFAASTLPVVAGAFLGIKDAKVERTTWQIGDLGRSVTIGETHARGSAPPLGPWFETLRAAIVGSGLSRGTHWIRAAYAHRGGEPAACEVLLDNEPWEPARAAVEAFSWPARADSYSVRVFLTVQGGLDLTRILPMFIEHPRMSEDDFAELLGTRGVPAHDARLVVGLVPLAFGRVMVARLQLDFTPTAVLSSRERGERRAIPLELDPIFAEATRLAERARRRGTLSREQYMSIALRSSEIKTLNQALEAGANSEDLLWAQPIITVP